MEWLVSVEINQQQFTNIWGSWVSVLCFSIFKPLTINVETGLVLVRHIWRIWIIWIDNELHCHYDNLRYHQWRQNCQLDDILFSLMRYLNWHTWYVNMIWLTLKCMIWYHKSQQNIMHVYGIYCISYSKMPVRFILSSVCLILSQFSQLSSMQYMGLSVFSLLICFTMIVRISALYLNIIIKSEVWPICPCLGLDHKTMVCAVWLSIFLWDVFQVYHQSSSLHVKGLVVHFTRSRLNCLMWYNRTYSINNTIIFSIVHTNVKVIYGVSFVNSWSVLYPVVVIDTLYVKTRHSVLPVVTYT